MQSLNVSNEQAEYKNEKSLNKGFNFELWSGICYEVCGCISAKRAHDWLVYGVKV